MSIEDDIETVARVTSALAGPLKVWVLHIDYAVGHDTITLHHTRESALAAAFKDLSDSYSPPVPATHFTQLRREGHTAVRDENFYTIEHQEVLE